METCGTQFERILHQLVSGEVSSAADCETGFEGTWMFNHLCRLAELCNRPVPSYPLHLAIRHSSAELSVGTTSDVDFESCSKGERLEALVVLMLQAGDCVNIRIWTAGGVGGSDGASIQINAQLGESVRLPVAIESHLESPSLCV